MVSVELTWVSAASHICLELVGLFEENRSTAWYVIYATFFNDIWDSIYPVLVAYLLVHLTCCWKLATKDNGVCFKYPEKSIVKKM